jgi:hypothetical protein
VNEFIASSRAIASMTQQENDIAEQNIWVREPVVRKHFAEICAVPKQIFI